MKFRVKDMDIATGDVQVCILNENDAALLDVHHGDRLLLRNGFRSTVAVVDIGESSKAVSRGVIGLFEEVLDALGAKGGASIGVFIAKKPDSIKYIKSKLDGKELTYPEIHEIIKDIVGNKLTAIELTTYITANYMRGMSLCEIVDLTKAMMQTGSVLKGKKKPVVDIHCIGGVPGNRTTMIVVPILAAAGLTVPKTSSRAITSPAGTADTMEVLCPVVLPVEKLRSILDSVGAFIVWGGSVNLAPADDKIINIEHPLSIDAEGQMLASIMAKKASVSATHVLIDIPVGRGAKIVHRKHAAHLARQFERIGKKLGIKVCAMITDGSSPIGRGVGPSLEARDCLWVLQNDGRGPEDLREKSLVMAGSMLEFVGTCSKGAGRRVAEEFLSSGKAYVKMKEIMRAQGGVITDISAIKLGRFVYEYKSVRSGKIRHIDNLAISKIARMAGSPVDPEAGVYINKQRYDYVKKGDVVLRIFSKSQQKLAYAKELLKEMDGVLIGYSEVV